MKSGSNDEVQLFENVDHIPFHYAEPVEQLILFFRRFMVVAVVVRTAADQIVNCCRTVTRIAVTDRYRGRLIMIGHHRERPADG